MCLASVEHARWWQYRDSLQMEQTFPLTELSISWCSNHRTLQQWQHLLRHYSYPKELSRSSKMFEIQGHFHWPKCKQHLLHFDSTSVSFFESLGLSIDSSRWLGSVQLAPKFPSLAGVWSVLFFRFWGPNLDPFSRLTQAYFEANSADSVQLTQNFSKN